MNWYKKSQIAANEVLPKQEVAPISPSQDNDSTSSPEFKAWFGEYPPRSSSNEPPKPEGSVAVDQSGKPKVFYHGTSSDFTAFEVGQPATNSNAFGSWKTQRAAIFFSENPNVAYQFAQQHGEEGIRTIPVYLNVRQPVDLRRGVPDDVVDELTNLGMNHRWLMQFGPNDAWELFDDEDGKMFVDNLKRLGYDGALLNEPVEINSMDSTTWAVFDPSQVKSAIGNAGTFDPQNTDITSRSMLTWYKRADADFRQIDPESDWEEAEQGYQLFKQEKIRYDSTKNIQQVAVENGNVIGALASGWSKSGEYGEDSAIFSFDLVVKPEFRRQRVGYELIRGAVAQYLQDKREYAEMGIGTLMRLWVVNPVLIPVLERDFGFQVEADHGEGGVHMIRY
jgi:GNAT superfamily N-acetyltransferase